MFLWFWTLLVVEASGMAPAPDAAQDLSTAVTTAIAEAPETPSSPAEPAAPASPDDPASPDAPDSPSEPASPASPSYTAEAQTPTGKFTTATEVKPILTATKPQWVGVREYDGQDLVYVTQIMAWRCGLIAMRVAINDAPLTEWPLPACHSDTPTPNALLPEDGLPYRAFPLGSVKTVTVELVYDDLSSDAATFVRQHVLIP